MNVATASATSAKAGHGSPATRARRPPRPEAAPAPPARGTGAVATSAGGIGGEVRGAVDEAGVGAGNLDQGILVHGGGEGAVRGFAEYVLAGHEDRHAPRAAPRARQRAAGQDGIGGGVQEPARVGD